MQEDQTVSFQPMYVDGRQPWFTQLFLLYILVVFVFFVVRAIRLAAGLHKLRKLRCHSASSAVADSLWTKYYLEAHSLKDISALTFFASSLNVTWYVADVFLEVRNERATNLTYVLPRLGEGLVALVLGLFICIALYSTSILFQAFLRRRNPRGSLSTERHSETDSMSAS